MTGTPCGAILRAQEERAQLNEPVRTADIGLKAEADPPSIVSSICCKATGGAGSDGERVLMRAIVLAACTIAGIPLASDTTLTRTRGESLAERQIISVIIKSVTQQDAYCSRISNRSATDDVSS